MKRARDDCVDAIKYRCIERLSLKRKITFYDSANKRRKTDYEKGIDDGRKATEDACYYFFTYSYNYKVKCEVENAVKEIKEFYERILQDLEKNGHNTLWLY
tara:strand:- start:7191 stop:7493 length:303 start_codon:yes stop_codon:yes gene_type:complete